MRRGAGPVLTRRGGPAPLLAVSMGRAHAVLSVPRVRSIRQRRATFLFPSQSLPNEVPMHQQAFLSFQLVVALFMLFFILSPSGLLPDVIGAEASLWGKWPSKLLRDKFETQV